MIDNTSRPSILLILLVVYSLCALRIFASLRFCPFYCISVLPNKRNLAIELRTDFERVLK